VERERPIEFGKAKAMKKVVVCLAVLCIALPCVATPVASTTQSGGAVVPPVGRDTLVDQTGDPGTGITAQDFESAYDAYDAQGADDFVVPAGETWTIDYVAVIGSWSVSGPANAVNIEFYADGGGMPGASVCSYPGAAPIDVYDANFAVNLPTDCVLTEGTYYVSVQGQVDYATGGQWFWYLNGSANGTAWFWQNPGNGFGTGCTSWADGFGCLGYTGPDLTFLLGGTGGGGGEVPTVSTWGLVVLALVGLAIGTVMFGRRRATA
jgi:hypothetical protein